MKRRMRWIALPLVALSCIIPAPALSKEALVPLRTKVLEADVIAIVRIEAARHIYRKGHYQNVATVRVLRPIKGSASGRKMMLDFDNGLACPNVTYARGEECLVFLSRERNGHYETYNSYYGKYLVLGGSVEYWQVKPYTSRTTSVDAVIQQIRTELNRR